MVLFVKPSQKRVSILLLILSSTFPKQALLHGHELHIGLLVPLSGQRMMGLDEVEIAKDLATERLNTDPKLTYVRRDGYNFTVFIEDTGCDTGQGLEKVVKMITELVDEGNDIDAFIGPACDNVCETAGLLAGRWKVPMVSFGCEEYKLSDRKLYPTFARTTSDFGSMSGFLKEVFDHMKWKRVMLVSTASQVWLETADEMQYVLNREDFTVLTWNIREQDWDHLADLLQKKGDESHVFVLMMFGLEVLRFMKKVEETNLLQGEHVFITIDFANMGKRTEHEMDGPHLTGLLDITVNVRPESEVFMDFVRTLSANVSLTEVGTDGKNCTHYEYGIHAGLMYDAMLLYGTAVDLTIKDGIDPREDGQSVASHMYGINIQGITGEMLINENGSRKSHFMLHNLQFGCYVPVALNENDGSFVYLNNTIVWSGGSTVTPLGRPYCGWDGSLCDDKTTVIIAASVSCILVLIISLVVGLIYWRYDKQRRESSRGWVIHTDDLKQRDRGTSRSRTNLSYSRQYGSSFRTFDSESRISQSSQSSYGQVFAEQYTYNGDEVASKKVVLNVKTHIVITKELSKEVNQVMEMSNPNICKFYGVCIDMGQEMTVWEYCRKGSLQDVIHNDKKYLEDMPFKISFINDITNGLRYLHRSKLGRHGRLKSANVLVDNRWSCKLAHMCIPSLARPDIPEGDNTNYESFLSSPPEILRDPLLAIPGTKEADMYAYGIILTEILTVSEIHEAFNHAYAQEKLVERHRARNKQKYRHRSRTWYPSSSPNPPANSQPAFNNSFYNPYQPDNMLDLNITMDSREIIARLKEESAFPFRPYIPEYIDHKTKNIIMECWREHPGERPAIDHVASIMRHINAQYGSSGKSLMEQMLDKVTREADMQAQELEEEKNRSDQLLYQMLPSTVADCLKKQIEVKPETFQSATIYFSDIQGFTELSSVSEPLEIVNFLNDVYYKFDTIIERYQVYKVETIGDAYMVCSGVPLRCKKHASEIATMALHIMSISHELKISHLPQHMFHMRIGLHSGPVAAGVVGRTMPRYCLFGDTVNTASRMESTGLAGKIQISEHCKKLLDLDSGYHYEPREPFHVKGKGILQTYFLVSKDGFSPQDYYFFDEPKHDDVHSLHSNTSLHEDRNGKPKMNGGLSHVKLPTNEDIPSPFEQTKVEILTPHSEKATMVDSLLSLNNDLSEVCVT